MVDTYYQDFLRRVELNFDRLSSDMYSGEHIFRDCEYAWQRWGMNLFAENV